MLVSSSLFQLAAIVAGRRQCRVGDRTSTPAQAGPERRSTTATPAFAGVRQVASRDRRRQGADRRPPPPRLHRPLPDAVTQNNPGAVRAPPPEAFPTDQIPVPDRWRLIESLGLVKQRWFDPYNQNTFKGDRPLDPEKCAAASPATTGSSPPTWSATR